MRHPHARGNERLGRAIIFRIACQTEHVARTEQFDKLTAPVRQNPEEHHRTVDDFVALMRGIAFGEDQFMLTHRHRR